MKNAMTQALIGGLFVILSTCASRAESGPPSWAIEEMQKTEGRWIADNSAHTSENEPYDAYGMEWRFAPGEQSLLGRLFAMANGRELGTLWEYRQFWHPKKNALWVIQFGTDGTYGEGSVELTDSGSTQVEQSFFARDGSSWRAGHRGNRDGERHSIVSFSIDSDGVWQKQRTYVWVRAPEKPPAASRGGIGYEPTVLIQFAVADLDRAIDFYTNKLGFRLELRSEELGWARIKPGVPGVTIGLGRKDVVRGSGSTSLNLGVSDLDAARRTLEERGVEFEGPTIEVPGVVRLADFRDPDGNRIRLADDVPEDE